MAEPAKKLTEPFRVKELTLLIAERVDQLRRARGCPPGRELDLWLEAEAQVKREREEPRA